MKTASLPSALRDGVFVLVLTAVTGCGSSTPTDSANATEADSGGEDAMIDAQGGGGASDAKPDGHPEDGAGGGAPEAGPSPPTCGGSAPADGALTTLVSGGHDLRDIAADDDYVYFVDEGNPNFAGSLNKCSVAGCGSATVLLSAPHVWGVAVDDTFVYYTSDAPTGGLERVRKDGTARETLVPQSGAIHVYVVDSYVYWIGGPGVMRCARANCGATVVSMDLTSYNTSFPQNLAFRDGWLYATFSQPPGGIMRCRPESCQSTFQWVMHDNSNSTAWGLAVDAAENVYFQDPSSARIVSCPSSGCAFDMPTVVQTGWLLSYLGIDGKMLYWVEQAQWSISRANLSDNVPTAAVVASVQNINYFTICQSHIFLTQSGYPSTVRRVGK